MPCFFGILLSLLVFWQREESGMNDEVNDCNHVRNEYGKISISIQKRKINYTVICVNEFANKFHIAPKEAFFYLYDYKGIEFIKEHYDIEHTLSLDDAVEDLIMVCRNNGGNY